MRLVLTLAALLALPALAGCGNCTGDPARDGFVCGVKALNEGTYDKRQDALEEEASAKEQAARDSADERQAAEAEAAAKAEEARQIARKLDQIDREIADRQAQMRQAQAGLDGKRQAELEELQRKLAALEKRHAELRNQAKKSAATQAEIDALEAQNAELRRLLDQMIKSL